MNANGLLSSRQRQKMLVHRRKNQMPNSDMYSPCGTVGIVNDCFLMNYNMELSGDMIVSCKCHRERDRETVGSRIIIRDIFNNIYCLTVISK